MEDVQMNPSLLPIRSRERRNEGGVVNEVTKQIGHLSDMIKRGLMKVLHPKEAAQQRRLELRQQMLQAIQRWDIRALGELFHQGLDRNTQIRVGNMVMTVEQWQHTHNKLLYAFYHYHRDSHDLSLIQQHLEAGASPLILLPHTTPPVSILEYAKQHKMDRLVDLFESHMAQIGHETVTLVDAD